MSSHQIFTRGRILRSRERDVHAHFNTGLQGVIDDAGRDFRTCLHQFQFVGRERVTCVLEEVKFVKGYVRYWLLASVIHLQLRFLKGGGKEDKEEMEEGKGKRGKGRGGGGEGEEGRGRGRGGREGEEEGKGRRRGRGGGEGEEEGGRGKGKRRREWEEEEKGRRRRRGEGGGGERRRITCLPMGPIILLLPPLTCHEPDRYRQVTFDLSLAPYNSHLVY